MADEYDCCDGPSLRKKPWKKLKIPPIKVGDNSSQNVVHSGKLCVFKCHFDNDSYTVMVSDLGKVWCESLDALQTKNRAQQLNPSVEASISKLLTHIEHSLDNEDTALTMNMCQRGDSLLMDMQTKLAGLPFIWQFKMTTVGSEMISQHLILPLLCMLGEYKRRQARLFALLKDKDKEIADLTIQGTKVSRRHLQTEAFEVDTFDSRMLTSEELKNGVRNWQLHSFTDDAQQLYSAVCTEIASSKCDNNKVGYAEETVNHEEAALCVENDNSSQVKENDVSLQKDSEIARREALVRRLDERKLKPKNKRKKIAF